jgi:hypothetical protein
MAPGWQLQLRAFCRALAVTLALAGTLGVVHARPQVAVILAAAPGAATSLEYTRAPMPTAPSRQAPRRRIASTHASATWPALRVLHSGRPVRLHPRGPYSPRLHTPVYLAYLRILC